MSRSFKTVLCPIDFSIHGDQATEYAVQFAHAFGGSLILAHIIHVPTEQMYDQAGHIQTFQQLKERALAKLQDTDSHFVAGRVPCEVVVEIGDPFQQLMQLVDRRSVDVIVLSPVRGPNDGKSSSVSVAQRAPEC